MKCSSTPSTRSVPPIPMMWPPKPPALRGAVALDHDVAGEQPDLGALVDRVAGDGLQLAVVRVGERLRQRDARAAPRRRRSRPRRGWDRSRSRRRPACRRRASRARSPARAGSRPRARWREPGPARRAARRGDRACRRATPSTRVAHAHDGRRVGAAGEGDRRAMLKRCGGGADAERALHGDPAGGEVQVGLVEDERAVDREARQRRRAHVQQHRPVGRES